VEEGSVAVEGVDEVGEPLEGDAIVFAVELLEGCVDFEDVGEGVGALQAELLVWDRSVGLTGSMRTVLTLDQQNPQSAVLLQAT
jgi:hypothetical protein